MMDMERWQGKVALVTGASSGIGHAVAADLARHGLCVAVTARRASRLEELVAQAGHDRMMVVAADLRDDRAIHNLFADVRSRWGGVDILINSAGVGYRSSLLDGDPSTWRQMFDLNVLALSICTQEAVSDMRRRGDQGHVIHISSLSGHRLNPGNTGNAMYGATKFAVRALTEGLRRELRALNSSIRVTAISPARVESEFAKQFTGSAAKAEEVYRQFKALQPEDIAAMVRFIISLPDHVELNDLIVRPTAQST